MKNFDPVWDYDYFKKAVSVVLAALLGLFAFALPKGDAVVAPAGEPSSVLTQTEVVTGSHARDPQTAAFLKKAETGFVIPGLAEGYIPQGICYDDAHGCYLISGYFEDDTPSRICMVSKNGALLKSAAVLTPGGKRSAGHFGGIAVFGDLIYLANTDNLYVLRFSALQAAEDSVQAEASLKTCLPATSGAEVVDGVLWLTQFHENSGKSAKAASPVYTTKGGHKLYARADGYVLDKAAPLGIRAESIVDGAAYPDRAMAIPPEVQGMTFTPDGKLVFSCSYGRTVRSIVSVYDDVTARKADETLTFGSFSVPLHHCRLIDRKATYTAPPMLQEVCVDPQGRLCFLSEAGAAKYRCGGGLDPYDEVLFWTP
ncbi:MAG: hypothetical protein IKH12_00320 [Clostridia bacterium]|nr:hypothetical protein [Clostridia bacterium]